MPLLSCNVSSKRMVSPSVYVCIRLSGLSCSRGPRTLALREQHANAFDQSIDIRLGYVVISPGGQSLRPMNIVRVTAIEDARNTRRGLSQILTQLETAAIRQMSIQNVQV